MKKSPAYWPIGLVLVVFAVYLWVLLGRYGPPYDLGKAADVGIFGDAFGPLTSLFNGLAFAGLLVAIKLQRDDLKLQRQELQLQRQELKETRQVMQQQEAQMRLTAEAAQRQLFESTFFALLGSFQRFVEGISYAGTGPLQVDASKGREALSTHFERLFAYEDRKITKTEHSNEIALIYAAWLRSYDHILGVYIDMLLAIFDFIETSDRPNKAFYFELIRASLSRPEKTLLFYHALSIPEQKRLKTYIERHSIFRDVNKQLLHRSERNIHLLYPGRAYDPDVAYSAG